MTAWGTISGLHQKLCDHIGVHMTLVIHNDVFFFVWLQALSKREHYGKLDKTVMSIWECCELLNEFVDESDPDLDEPQIEHLLQTAEAIRKDYPNEEWLHLTGLIHGMSYTPSNSLHSY